MMKAVEEQGCTIYSVFPLRSEIIPKAFRLDTTSLVNLLFTKEIRKKKRFLANEGLSAKQGECDKIYGNVNSLLRMFANRLHKD